MAAYTSSQDGDWSVSATWGGAGVPGSGDTATISHAVTVSDAQTCGAVTLNKTLNISGVFTLGGNVGCAASGWRIDIQAGGTLDLFGYTITPTAAGEYRASGTPLARATVTSGAAQGSFAAPGANAVTLSATYCDFDNIGGTLGRTHTSAIVQTVTYCTFENCGRVDVDATGVNVGCGFIFEYNRITDWASATPVASSSLIPNIYQTTAAGVATRRARFNVWDNSMNANVGAFEVRALGADVSENVAIEAKLSAPAPHSPTINRNFWSMENDQDVVKIGAVFSSFCGNYVHFPQGGHIMTPANNVDVNISGNIFDATDGGEGINAVLFTAQASNVKISNNILFGKGNLLAYTNNPNSGSMQFRKNTTAVDHAGVLGNGQYFAPWLIAEQTATNITPAAAEYWDNFHFDTDDSNSFDAAIDLLGTTADQIDLVNYNGAWGTPNGNPSPPLNYVNVTITGGVGANDAAVDPQFFDRSRDLAGWDATLGGPGTTSNAISELKKLNQSDFNDDYRVSKLFDYVASGYQPQNASMALGRYGGTVGACSIAKSVNVPLASWFSGRLP